MDRRHGVAQAIGKLRDAAILPRAVSHLMTLAVNALVGMRRR